MRHFLAIMLISVAVASLHAGKYAAYVLCKWEMAALANKADCDCEKHLESHDDDAASNTLGTGIMAKEPFSDFGIRLIQLPALCSQQKDVCFAEYDISLMAGFKQVPFQPPAEAIIIAELTS